jgi:hypothetical protein
MVTAESGEELWQKYGFPDEIKTLINVYDFCILWRHEYKKFA